MNVALVCTQQREERRVSSRRDKLTNLRAARDYYRIEWQGLREIYVLGITEQRVTFRDQQVRALNLALALTASELPETERLPAGARVAIIGGGVAGVTAALGLVRRGCSVVLFEERHRVVDLQSSCSHRRVHPNIYDWPEEHWRETLADVPILSWRAGEARKVCDDIRRDFIREAGAWRDRLTVQTGVSSVELLMPSGASPKIRIEFRRSQGSKERLADTFDAVVMAVGFGLEPDVGSLGSYWAGDPLPNLPPRTTVLVSGSGDGGLTDVLRASLEDCDHDRLEKLAGHPSLGALISEVITIEQETSARCLLEAYGRLTIPDEFLTILRPRPGVRVLFNHSEEGPLIPEASALNRFLVHCLIKNGVIETIPGRLGMGRRNWPPRRVRVSDGRWRYRIDVHRSDSSRPNVSVDVDVLIVRHGPASALRRFSPPLDDLVIKRRKERRGQRAQQDSFRRRLWENGDFDAGAIAGGTHSESDNSIALFKSAMLIGSKHGNGSFEEFAAAATALGKKLAESGTALIVCSPFDDSLDSIAAKAYAKTRGRMIDFHVPRYAAGSEVDSKMQVLEEELKGQDVPYRIWLHIPPDDNKKEAWQVAWSISQDAAYENADVVIALGGRMDGTAWPLIQRADRNRKPLIPFGFLGGAAEKALTFSRQGKEDVVVRSHSHDVEEVVRLANEAWRRAIFPSESTPSKFFISRSHRNADFASFLKSQLTSQPDRPRVFLGDEAVSSQRELLRAIREQMDDADAFIVLWSRDFALSDFCREELDIALEHYRQRKTPVWIFALDDSGGLGSSMRSEHVKGRTPTKESLVAEVLRLIRG